MPYFKMVRQALPAKTVADARQLANDVCRRKAVGKFSVASEWTNATERQRALGIAEIFLNGPAADLFRSRFDVEPALCLNIMTVRHQAPEGAAEAVGWHLDLGFVGDDSPFLVSWTALQARSAATDLAWRSAFRQVPAIISRRCLKLGGNGG